MPARVCSIALAALFLCTACKKKAEIVPDGARQVMRSDKTENNTEGTADVSLREYKFSLAGNLFLCEAREFAEAGLAAEAAKKSIAERPQEEQKNDHAHYAVSGRSLWLRSGRQLTWCMLSSGKNESVPAAMQPLREAFLKKYREGT